MKLGIDNLDNYKELFEGKRVGLITNPTGISSEFEYTIDVLNRKTKSEDPKKHSKFAGDNLRRKLKNIIRRSDA